MKKVIESTDICFSAGNDYLLYSLKCPECNYKSTREILYYPKTVICPRCNAKFEIEFIRVMNFSKEPLKS